MNLPLPEEICGNERLQPQTRHNLGSKVVDLTYKLHGNKLIYAKDLPTYVAEDANAL
jgi:peptidyl-tRNA hydrolase